MTALDVNAVIQRMVRLVENQKEMRKIHIEQDYGADLPEILGDANQLQQVLLNLFLNAAAAMPDGGILTITTRADADPRHDLRGGQRMWDQARTPGQGV